MGANILFCVVLGNVILCVYGEDAGVRSSLALGVGDVVSAFDERVGLAVVRGGGRAVHLRVDAQPLQFIVGGLFGGALDVEGDGQFGLRDPLFAIPLQLDGLLSLLADDQRMGLAHIGAVLLDDLGCLDSDGAGIALGGGTGDVADGVLTLRRLVILAPVVDVLVIADDLYASADRTLNVLLAGLLGGAQGMEGDRQFGLSDPLFAIPLQFNGLFGGFTGNQRMNRVAHIGAVLLDELGCPDGNGAGVAIGGGAHDIADGVLAQRRLILLFAVVDVLVIADNRHASANRVLNGLLIGLDGLPLSGVGDILGYGLSDLGVPAVEHKALTGGSAAGESGSLGVLLQIGMDIVLKGFSVHAVGVSNGVELFPLSDVGRIFGHGFSNRGFPAEELVARAGGSALESGGGILVLCRISLIRECLAVHTVGVGHGVGVLFPNGVQIRPAVHGLAGYVAVLTLTAPELEGVAGAGRGGSVRGGKGRTKGRSGAVQPTFGLAVVILEVSQGFLTLEVNDLVLVIDHALQIRPPVDGFLLQTGRGICGVALVDIKQAVVVPAVELVVPGVIVGNVDRGQVNDMPLRLAFERDVLISLRGVAVAINHKVDGEQLFFALDREGNGVIDNPPTLYIFQRKGLGVVTGQGVLAEVGVVLRYILISSDDNVTGVAVGFVAGDIADVVCSLDQREGCGGVRLGLRGAGHFHGRFQLGQIFSTGLCGRNNLRHARDVENNGGAALNSPAIIRVFQGNGRVDALGIMGSAGIGVELLHILLRVDGDSVGVAVFGVACNLTGGVGAGNQSVALGLKLVGSLAVGAVDGDIIDQTAEVALTGSGGLVGLGGSCFFPHGVQRSGPGVAILDNIIAILGYGTRHTTSVDCIRPVIGLPALKDIAFPGGDGILHRKGVVSDRCICCRPRISTGRAGAAIGIIVQRVCIFRGGVGVLRYEINRSALIAGGRTALVKRPRCGIGIGFFRPTDDLVAAVDGSAACGGLDIRNRDRVVVICGVGVIRLVLANKLGLFGRTVVVANVEFVTHIQDGESDIDLMPGVQSGGIYIGSGNRRHGHSSWTGLALLPFGGIGDIRSHGSRNGGIPAGEGIAVPGKGAAESGGRGTSRQVADLIGKYCAVCTVSVCNGECFRLFRCRGILVLRLLLRGGVGLLLALVHYDGLGLGFVSPRRILCQRSRGQKCEDHEQCQKQTENSAQTMVFHLEILSFHLAIHAGGTDRLHGNAIITFMPELYAISHQKSMGKDVDFLQLGKKQGRLHETALLYAGME